MFASIVFQASFALRGGILLKYNHSWFYSKYKTVLSGLKSRPLSENEVEGIENV